MRTKRGYRYLCTSYMVLYFLERHFNTCTRKLHFMRHLLDVLHEMTPDASISDTRWCLCSLSWSAHCIIWHMLGFTLLFNCSGTVHWRTDVQWVHESARQAPMFSHPWRLAFPLNTCAVFHYNMRHLLVTHRERKKRRNVRICSKSIHDRWICLWSIQHK